ncbi:acyltransferase family protein [Paenibacillus sp. FA6]|uniref:acyltransferase family protein n=1 Tax=Paenibacillus sp. FA6 TaxID=3413029 RepID=UPI003F65E87F
MDTSILKQGETYFLNLRFLLIVTVFIANAIEPLILQMSGLHQLFLWILTFHMPLFVLVTGYFAKSSLTGKVGRRTLTQIGLQYIIFQSIYSFLDYTFFHVANTHHSFFAPYLLLWFLASHICWRLISISTRKLSPTQQIILSLILGVLVGYLPFDGVWLSISRTFVFLPFFIIGTHFNFSVFMELITTWRKRGFAFVSVGLFVILGLWGLNVPTGWLFGSMTFIQLGQHEWYAGIFRIALYILQFISAAAFMAWIPMIESRITHMGRRTLYVFLLHGFIIRLANISGVYQHINTPEAAVLLIVTAIALTILLAQPFVTRLAHPLVEPSVHWIIHLENRAFRRS